MPNFRRRHDGIVAISPLLALVGIVAIVALVIIWIARPSILAGDWSTVYAPNSPQLNARGR